MKEKGPQRVDASAGRRLRVIRAVGAAAVVAAVGLIANGIFISRNEANLSRDPAAAYTIYEERFAPLKAVLPTNEPVGYFNNRDDRDFEKTRGYYLCRYVVSPARVLYETRCDLAIGDFYRLPYPGKSIRGILDANGYGVEKDLGNGIWLLRRKADAAAKPGGTP